VVSSAKPYYFTMDIEALVFPALIVLLKMTCFIIGYLIVRLGYNLLVSGIKGEFKFTSEYKGIKGGLISSSPGLLFVLLGTLLIAYTVFVDKPFKYDWGKQKAGSIQLKLK